ncbi:MAG: flagellar hook-basal body protein [Verrucomicrobiota bacterium]
MNVSLFQAAAALNANSRWQESIAENLSSSSIPGFKRQELSFASIQAGLMPPTAAHPSGSLAHFTIPVATVATNFGTGEMKRTGVETDVAIEGRGFFEIQLPNGATAYTRDGEFQPNAQGQLATKQGYLVLGESGPIQLDMNQGGPISISQTGEFNQGADAKGKIKVVDFNDPSLLTSIGGGLFLASNTNLQTAEVPSINLRSGFLENANTSATAEMVNLISAMRQYEANQHVIQMQDDRMGKTISELGTTN